MRVPDAELVHSVGGVAGRIEQLGAAGPELLMEGVDVVDVDVGVETIGRDGPAIRLRTGVLEAGEVHVTVTAGRVAVVRRGDLPGVTVEAELVAVVIERAGDVVHEQDGRVVPDAHARERMSCTTSLF